MTSGDTRLTSWKSIARYFGKSERTVRRWEAEEGLPVQRHMHRSQGSVFAMESDLAAWQKSRSEVSNAQPLRDDRAETTSLIVMPLQFLGTNAAQDFLAVGFTDELISGLSRLDGLRVISRTSSHALSARSLSTAEIRKLVNADILIEGSIRQTGENLKISVQMINCRTDQSSWSQTTTCDLDGIFDAQAELVDAISKTLSHSMSNVTGDPQTVQRSRDRNIWEALVRARIESLRWTPAAIRNAAGLLEASIERYGDDPALVSALGRCHLFLREIGSNMSNQPLDAAEECLTLLRRSVPDEPATHQLAGWIAYQRGDIPAAMHSLRAAYIADADDPDTLALLSYSYLLSGLDDLAHPIVDQLIAIDPLTPLNHSLAACKELFAGRFDAAVESYAYMCNLDPSNKMAHLFHVMAMSISGEKQAVLKKVNEVAASFDTTPIDRLLHAFASGVRSEEIRSAPRIDMAMKATTVDMFPRLMAQAHGLSGNKDAALEWLSLAADRGFRNWTFMTEIDPSLALLREDEEFIRLMTRIKIDQQELRHQFS
ncbi:hypothetical protein DX908_03750 [Parvularcula marina]|uniref:Uncharacterized protein n=2 Tax=Parvularcula marina TaxID=2292771 RepID=A0A371RGC6_9PROT|nr:hypothetical protein DX908_03750 [Parvularcula marina]